MTCDDPIVTSSSADLLTVRLADRLCHHSVVGPYGTHIHTVYSTLTFTVVVQGSIYLFLCTDTRFNGTIANKQYRDGLYIFVKFAPVQPIKDMTCSPCISMGLL